MFKTVEEITVGYEVVEHGEVVQRRRQLAASVISNHAGWATIVFAFQDLQQCGYADVLYSIQRWRKVGDRWRRMSRMNLRPELAT